MAAATAVNLHADAHAHSDRLARTFNAIQQMYLPDNTTQMITDSQINALTTLQGFEDLLEGQMAKMHADVQAQLHRYLRAISGDGKDWASALGLTNTDIANITTGWPGLLALTTLPGVRNTEIPIA